MTQTPTPQAADRAESWEWLRRRLDALSPTWDAPDARGAISRTMPDTALLGNGQIGVVSSGDGRSRTLIVSAIDLWNSHPVPRPAGLGGLTLGTPAAAAPDPKGFHERQRLSSGVIETRAVADGIPITLTARVAEGSRAVLITLTSLHDAVAELPIVLWAGAAHARPEYRAHAGSVDGLAFVGRTTAPGPHSMAHGALAVAEAGGALQLDAAEADTVRGRLVLAPGQAVELVIGVAVDTVSIDRAAAAASATARAALRQIPVLDAAREQWWREYWLRSWIDLDDDLMERYYYCALYQLACSARPGSVAPGIGGIWTTSDDILWYGDLHLNYNAQAPFYGVHSANRSELVLPFVDAIVAFLPEARRRSRDELALVNPDYLRARPDLAGGIEGGVLFPVGISPFGQVATEGYYSQVLGGAFAANLAARHWRYTRDAQFADGPVYDLLAGVATFFERWSVWDAATRRYTIWGGAHEGGWGRNSSIDVALVDYVLRTLIELAESLDRDADRLDGWRHLRDHLPPPPVTSWDERAVYALADPGTSADGRDIRPGDNTVNLEFIHPGERLTMASPPQEREIAIATIDVMDSWSQDNSFPKVFTQAARIGYRPDELRRRLRHELATRSALNGRVSDPYHGLEKAGAVEAVNSMLLHSAGGVVFLFPSWPRTRDAAFVQLRAEGAFLVSATLRGGLIGGVSVRSESGAVFRLAAEARLRPVVHDGSVAVATSREGDVWSFATTPGHDYAVELVVADR